jgi:predicted RNase H-like nuclease
MAALGVDGCPGGWVAARVAGGRVTWHAGSFSELLALDATVVGVDMPIGLPPDGRRRAADLAARQLLGVQRASVFFTPPRGALHAASQSDATRLSRAAGAAGVSIQAFHLLGKVAEVDALLQQDVDLVRRVVEVHPEVSLRRLGGRPLPPKRTADGRERRLALLRTWLPGLALPTPRPGRARPDDCLDAVAVAWSADRWHRGVADVLGGEPDATGLPMCIVV